MSDELNARLAVLDARVNFHDREIATLKEANRELVECLQSIRETLTSVKWLFVGSFVTVVAYAFGLFDAVKALI